MNASGLTYEQNSVVNAVWTLINNMDDRMREALLRKIEGKKAKAVSKTAKDSSRHAWYDIPISDDVMSMTFPHRKPVGDYKDILEKELREKYK